MHKIFLFLFVLFPACMIANETVAKYHSLDPTSISEHLAFYSLYPDSECGKKALQDAWRLILLEKQNNLSESPAHPPLAFPSNITAFIELIQPNEKLKTSTPNTEDFTINAEALTCLEMATKKLLNRKLKGFSVTSTKELTTLESHEIDVARALFLLQFENDPNQLKKVRLYEATIDLMALQVLARTGFESSAEDKIRAINHLIFYEMGFRFPPHSTYSETIDYFTFLPSVLDSRRGVCLGVSTLYLAIAERIGLPLESITPPGHIFLRYKQGDTLINIETTMRGVHIPTDEYLSLTVKELDVRTNKEVVGMSFVNLASTFLGQGKWQQAADTYEKALPFMPDDPLVHELLGSAYFILGKKRQAEEHLKIAQRKLKEKNDSESLIDDILAGNVTKESLQPYFLHVDETKKSLEKKRDELLCALKRSPRFRQGLFSLASTYLQLRKPDLAIHQLEKLAALDKTDLTCCYYLAALYHDRYNAPCAIAYLDKAQEIAKKQNYTPRQLIELEVSLSLYR
jgi:tetratricopeptide (TPR) repeat protein